MQDGSILQQRRSVHVVVCVTVFVTHSVALNVKCNEKKTAHPKSVRAAAVEEERLAHRPALET